MTRTVRVRLEVEAAGARRDVQAFGGDLKQLRTAVGDANQHLGTAGGALRTVGAESKTAGTHVGGLTGVVQRLGLSGGVGAALGGLGAIEVVRKVVGGASDLNETINKSQQVFKGSAGSILAWSSTSASAMGMSQRAALDGASSFQNLFSQIGLTGKASVGMSTNLVKLASDFASFHNAQPEQVMDALLSATRGEYDALQRFVPTVSAAAIQTRALADSGKASAKELTDAEKATALYEIVVEGAGAATGDFARTSSGAANQQRILVANLEDTAASIGNAVLPAYQGLLGVINTIGPGTIAAGAGVALLSNRLAASSKDGEGLLASIGDAFRTRIDASREAGEKFSTTLGTMRAAGDGLRTAASGIVGLFGGPWGLALTAATIGVGLLVKQHQDEEATNQRVIASGRDLVGVYKDQGTAAGDAAFQRKLGEKEFATEYNWLRQNGVAAYDLQVAYQGNATVQGTVLDTLRNKRTANQEEMESIQRIADVQNRSLNPSEQARFQALQDSNSEIAVHVGRLQEQWHGTQDVAAAQRDYAASASSGAVALDQWNVTLARSSETSRTTAGSVATLGAQSTVLQDTLGTLTSATSTAEEKAKALRTAYDALFGAQIGLNEASETYQASIDSLSESIGKNGTTTDINTAAGRANRDAIEARLQSSVRMYEADVAAGTSVEEATRRHEIRTQKLWEQIPPTMRNDKATQDLVSTYGTVPTQVDTVVSVYGVEAVLARLKEAKAGQLALEANISGAEALGTLNRDAYWRSIYRARGGPVYGPGGPRDDLIPAVGPRGARYRLSDGEYVQQASAVDYYGLELMQAINERVIPKDLLSPTLLRALNSAFRRPAVDQPGDGSAGIAFAGGGLVSRWPFVVDVTKTKIPVPQASPQAGAALTFLRAQNGKPYVWAAAGPGGYDCSGIVSAVWNILHGKSPYNHTFSTMNQAGYFPKPGFGAPLTAGWANPGEMGGGSVGHTAGVLTAGMTAVPFESGGGWGGVHVGPGTTPVRSFAHIGHFAQGGAVGGPNVNLTFNMHSGGAVDNSQFQSGLIAAVKSYVSANGGNVQLTLGKQR